MRIKPQSNRRGWIMVVLVCLGIFAPNYAQYQLSALGPRYMEAMSINTSQFSSIMTGPLIPGIFFSLISGLLVDKFGAKRVLMVSFVVTALGAVLRIWAGSFQLMLMCMIMIGFTATFLNTNGAKIFGQWVKPERVSTLMGIFMAIGNAGMALGTGTGALYPSMTAAFVVSAIIAVAAAIMWMLFAKDKKEHAVIKATSPPVMECLKVAVKSPGVWATSLAIMLICTGGISMSLFLPTALSTRGFDETTAGAVGMSITLGAMVSCFVTPLIDAKLKNAKLLMVVYGLLGAVGVAFAWRAPQGLPLVSALFVTGFLSTGPAPLLVSIPIQLKEIGPKFAGTAGGFVATIQLIGSVVIPTYIITPISGSNYNILFYLLALVMVLFSVFALFLPNLRKLHGLV